MNIKNLKKLKKNELIDIILENELLINNLENKNKDLKQHIKDIYLNIKKYGDKKMYQIAIKNIDVEENKIDLENIDSINTIKHLRNIGKK